MPIQMEVGVLEQIQTITRGIVLMELLILILKIISTE